MSNNKMKGLLKGLRYIAHIFEPNDKEQEMQIGHPTDVKHVAHIGWDGPSVNSPSWMNEFRSAPLSSLDTSDDLGDDVTRTRFASHDFNEEDSPDLRPSKPESKARLAPLEVPHRELPELPLPRPSRRNAPARAASADATYGDASSTFPAGRVTRRVRSNEASPVGSPASNRGDKAPPRQGRRHGRSKETRNGAESPTVTTTDQPPPVPRQSRRKKNHNSKGSYGDGGSTRTKPLAEAGMSEAAVMEENSYVNATPTTTNDGDINSLSLI